MAMRDVRVRILSTLEELEALTPAWEALATATLEPNPFYESWMLLPALRLLCQDKPWRVAVVEAAGPSVPVQARLLGLIPLELQRGIGPLPLTSLATLEHPYCFLRTPLIRASAAAEVLDAFFARLREGVEGSYVLDLDGVASDGPYWHALLAHQARHPTLTFTAEAYTRALFRRAKGSEDFLAALPSRYLRDLRRRQRRLEEEGRVELVSLISGEEPTPWLNEFVRLEASGWKGQQGTALGSSARDRGFFQQVAKEAHLRGRLSMTALKHQGRTLAMNCQLLALPGAFAFKIAYDESASRFAPGVLLELNNIQNLHARAALEWVDSCASPEQAMTNRLWPHRRMVHHLRVAATPRVGGLLVAMMPLARWMSRMARSPGAAPEPHEAAQAIPRHGLSDEERIELLGG